MIRDYFLSEILRHRRGGLPPPVVLDLSDFVRAEEHLAGAAYVERMNREFFSRIGSGEHIAKENA